MPKVRYIGGESQDIRKTKLFNEITKKAKGKRVYLITSKEVKHTVADLREFCKSRRIDFSKLSVSVRQKLPDGSLQIVPEDLNGYIGDVYIDVTDGSVCKMLQQFIEQANNVIAVKNPSLSVRHENVVENKWRDVEMS